MSDNSISTLAVNMEPFPFFKLPFDVRQKVYREFFQGSRLEVRNRWYQSDPTDRYTKYSRMSVGINREFLLLLTCKAAHKEALDIYWSQTIIKCSAVMSFEANLQAIPFCARPFVRALESVPLHVDVHPRPRMPLRLFLGLFPRLEYCEFKRPTVKMYCHAHEIPRERLLEEVGSDEFRALALAMNPDRPPIFVQRIFFFPQKDWNSDVSEL